MDLRTIFKWISQLADPAFRGPALQELSEHRQSVPDLALMLWQDTSKMVFVLYEISSINPCLNWTVPTEDQMMRVRHAFTLFECLAAHPGTRVAFLAAKLPVLVYPCLQAKIYTAPFETVRLTSLAVIITLLMNNEQETITFLLQTNFVSVCLEVMMLCTNQCKRMATYIIERILLNDRGLTHCCQNRDRFWHLISALETVVITLAKEPTLPWLKRIVTCYVRLSDDPEACLALRYCLPRQLWDGTFAAYIQMDPSIYQGLAILQAKIVALLSR